MRQPSLFDPADPAEGGGGDHAARTPVSEEERIARVALGVICEPGDPRVSRLVELMGALELHDRLVAGGTDLSGLHSESAARLAAASPAAVLDQARRRGIRFVVPGDPEWPEPLADLATVEPVQGMTGAPLGLWLRGPLPLAAACRSSVAIVGSRSATSYGAAVAADLGGALAADGVTVVSGAAFGIDKAAHQGALAARGSTVAVLACGVDRAYPTAHTDLLRLLAEEGLVVSELPPGCAPTRYRFLARNRLIAALTVGTVVVEAALRSGALNTANWASRLNRVLMGVPGSVTSASSEGVHEQIRTGAATLVARPAHVLELVSPMGTATLTRPRGADSARDRLDPTARRVLEAVPLTTAASSSAVARTAGLAVDVVAAALGELAAAGWVSGLQGRWRRTGAAIG